jgi:hypothetical protein
MRGAEGLAILLRKGTLAEVSIAPGELRDQRELLRLQHISGAPANAREEFMATWDVTISRSS